MIQHGFRIMRRLLLICLAVAAALAGCASPRFPLEAFRAELRAPYVLGAGDRLRIIVFGQDALSNSYAVDGAGHISMPLIGTVAVLGMTTEQVARALEARYKQGFLREPQVAVEVEAYRPFFILGEVTAAGQYPYVSGMTVEKAVAVAGGFTPRAWQWDVEITRIIQGTPIIATVPRDELVRPGDTINVRERFF
jgi:polysaccharide export outer membrane protein